MNAYKLFCRVYQAVLNIAMYCMPWSKPELLVGAGAVLRLPALVKNKGVQSVLLVTGKVTSSIGLAKPLIDGLCEQGIACAIFDETVPNPTIDNIECALKLYHANACQAIIAFGGGSAMDCAKGVAARVAKPNQSIPQMKGVLKVLRPTPTVFAVPTTAGTGSEATLAAVITNPQTHEKYAINDFVLIPQYAVLDPLLTVNLPQHITSTTGMDALTHAVEAYIGFANTRETSDSAEKAVRLIFANLYEAYSNGSNVSARENMQMASYWAGIAFTRAYVGNVHAIAHTLGGFYGVPHGLANAVILPHVLEYYGKYAAAPLARLGDIAGVTAPDDDSAQKAQKFIASIRELNAKMEIPSTISGIQEQDLPLMIQRALSEANPLYPVPVIFDANDMEYIYRKIME